MILQPMENGKRCRAALLENDAETVYDVTFDVCANPTCTCNVVHINLTPIPDGHGMGEPAPTRTVPVDVERRKPADKGEVKKRGPARDFAKKLIKLMDEEDFQFLLTRYLAAKKHRTDTARPEDINAWFEYDKIEEEGLLTAYKDILPYAELFLVSLDGEECAVLDLYCLKNGCSCTETGLNIYRIKPGGAALGREIVCFFVDYRKKKWQPADSIGTGKGWIDQQTARQAIEEQIPSIYARMKERHGRLTKIYSHCRRKQLGIGDGPAQAVKIGRNAPCPCGSGRKYKKCCQGK
ncbi:MAG: SEC-C metal-binding domain-containing protein [Desulfobulbaceae bacterium]|nr:SEC-C metal-binding domain-containing protein [Desulfobulbaceae bacterium]